MTTKNCDKCDASMTSINGQFTVGRALGSHVDLRNDCLRPYLELLQDDGLLPSDLTSVFLGNSFEDEEY